LKSNDFKAVLFYSATPRRIENKKMLANAFGVCYTQTMHIYAHKRVASLPSTHTCPLVFVKK
jgi:hypothetical protein